MMPPPQAKAWSLVVVLAAALVPRGAFAQMSTVTCLSSFGWMNNSLVQDPCLVASYLESTCGAIINFDPLPTGYHYEAPSAALANPCVCNTVTYSMVSACADCQNRTYDDWTSWSTSCSKFSIGEYPNDIPTGTKVPNWAYLNVSGGFDPVAAQSNGDLPESTATSGPTTTVTHLVTTTASLTSVPTSLTSSSGAATGSSARLVSDSTSSNVGAIAGGVVGGIVGAAAIIGLAIWYLVKRRRSSTTPSDPNYKLAYVEDRWDTQAVVDGRTHLEAVFDKYYKPPTRAPAKEFALPRPSHENRYGDAWMREAVKARQAADQLAHNPRQEPTMHLSSPLEEAGDIAWWGLHSLQFPTLARIAQDYFPIQGSAVPSEQAFLSGGITSAVRRNALATSMFNSLQLLKAAYRNGYDSATVEAEAAAMLDA